MKKLLLSLTLTALALTSNAETTKLIVPVPPGGLVDNLARLMATEMSKKLNESVVVENKPGASGSIATSFAASATPNGKTLIIGHNGTINIFPVLNPSFDGYNSKSLVPVCLIGGGPLVLVTSTSVPANNLTELLQYFKENPDKASWASPGVGSVPHLLGEQLKFQYGVGSMVHVLYKGMAPAQVDVIGNRVTLMFDLYGPQITGVIGAGKLKPIFITDSKPLGNIAAAPSPSLHLRDWFGLFVSAGTPEPVLKTLQTTCNSIINDSSVKEQLTAFGTPPLNVEPKDAQNYIEQERKRWTTIINRLDLTEKK